MKLIFVVISALINFTTAHASSEPFVFINEVKTELVAPTEEEIELIKQTITSVSDQYPELEITKGLSVRLCSTADNKKSAEKCSKGNVDHIENSLTFQPVHATQFSGSKLLRSGMDEHVPILIHELGHIVLMKYLDKNTNFSRMDLQDVDFLSPENALIFSSLHELFADVFAAIILEDSETIRRSLYKSQLNFIQRELDHQFIERGFLPMKISREQFFKQLRANFMEGADPHKATFPYRNKFWTCIQNKTEMNSKEKIDYALKFVSDQITQVIEDKASSHTLESKIDSLINQPCWD